MYRFIFADEIVRQRHAELVEEAEAGKARQLARRENSVRWSWNFTWRTVPNRQFAH